MGNTIEDVAKLAGVSRATAGRVIGNYGSVSEDAKERVLNAIKELNYQPNVMAQGLRSHSTKTIAVILGSIKNNYCNALVYAIEKEAQKNGFNIIICNTREDIKNEIKHIQNMRSRQVDGIILMSAFKTDEEIPKQYKKLYDSDTSMVFVDRKIHGLDKDIIMTNNIEASYNATEYLINLGHKKIGVIATKDYSTVRERIDGYKRALEDNHIEIHPEYIEQIDGLLKEDAEKAANKLMDEHPEITAIYVLNNSLCCGVLLELKKRNLKLKEDISLIVWDDEELNELYDITTVVQPIPEIGKKATAQLFEIIKGNKNKLERTKELKAEMVIRDSCKNLNSNQ